MSGTSKLTILGAVYGIGDVTAKAQSLVSNNSLSVTADNATFGDTFYGVVKTLAIIYQYGNQLPQTVIAPENSEISINYVPTATYCPTSDKNTLTIVGAAYGLGEVTSRMQASVSNGNLTTTANTTNCSYGIDTFPGNVKVLTVVYQYGSNAMLVSITQENSSTEIHFS